MTSRERIIAALQHTQPDRVPLDIGSLESSGISALAYNRLREHLGLPQGETQIFDPYQQVVKVEDDVLAALEIDAIPLVIEPLAWKDAALQDGSPCQIPAKWNPQEDADGSWFVEDDAGHTIARMPAGGFYFEPVYAPLADVQDPAELDEHLDAIHGYDWPGFADETLDDIAARAERLFNETDKAIVFNLQCHLMAAGMFLRGYEQFMIDLLTDKPFVHGFMRRLVDGYKQRAEKMLHRLDPFIQVVLVNDDLGTQNGPITSLNAYREMLWPYQKELFGTIKAHTEAFLLMHSCGSVVEFIPHLMEAGVDALNPVQVSAAGMDSADLKRQFGDRLTFWGGGCDTQQVLGAGTPADVAAEVQRRVADFAPGGGFVFTQVHNIQPNVPPENVVAMVDALRDAETGA